MSYITKDYYSNEFKGRKIPVDEFDRIADISTDIIDSIITVSTDNLNEEQTALLKKATAYQCELIYEQGGTDTILGRAESTAISSESLGGYSVSINASNKTALSSINGIPISTFTINLLRKAGLYSRWAYSDYAKRSRNAK